MSAFNAMLAADAVGVFLQEFAEADFIPALFFGAWYA